ncbi:MAG: hypothetical protein AABZ47_13250 [Planctomycetota bacterium]
MKSAILECVVDTTVLQKANAPITDAKKQGKLFRQRLAVLNAINGSKLIALFSERLMQEYREHVHEPRNLVVTEFLNLISSPRPGKALKNYKTPWSGQDRSNVKMCRFPSHDVHVLRTAVRPNRTLLITEDGPMLKSADCILRRFDVKITEP